MPIVSQSQSQSPAGLPTPFEIAAEGGYILTVAEGHAFVSTVDDPTPGPFDLDADFTAKVDLSAPNATLEILPDGPRYLVEVTAKDGGPRLPMGTFQLTDGRRVSVIPLGLARV